MNLLEVFKGMPEYVVIKMRDDFPDYTPGQDIDILCKDIFQVMTHIGKYYRLKDFSVSQIGLDELSYTHYHFDHYLYESIGKIDIRFDLYSEYISPQLTADALQFKTTRKGVNVPISIFDSIIKSYEYLVNGKRKYEDYAKYKCILEEYESR